ncbi:hypothetical protein DRC69_21870 [Salmonella enterica]|nr:hypothetical protein [Salmonella enterica]
MQKKNPWRGCQGDKCHNLHFRRYISPVTVSSQGKWHHTGQLMKLFKGEGHPYPVPVVVGLSHELPHGLHTFSLFPGQEYFLPPRSVSLPAWWSAVIMHRAVVVPAVVPVVPGMAVATVLQMVPVVVQKIPFLSSP